MFNKVIFIKRKSKRQPDLYTQQTSMAEEIAVYEVAAVL